MNKLKYLHIPLYLDTFFSFSYVDTLGYVYFI